MITRRSTRLASRPIGIIESSSLFTEQQAVLFASKELHFGHSRYYEYTFLFSRTIYRQTLQILRINPNFLGHTIVAFNRLDFLPFTGS
jgi:hypothetical protein